MGTPAFMSETKTLPAQHQDHQPGHQKELAPQPQSESKTPGSNRLTDRVLLVTGGDSGIGRAVAILAAKEGADVAIAYLEEDDDANETRRLVQSKGRQCELLVGDIGQERTARGFIQKTIERFGRLDVLVNGAGEQHPQERPEDISPQQLEQTFRTNVFSQFFTVQEALKYLKRGSSIINIASITAYEGSPKLIDYSATKGALVSFTRALSNAIVERGIRVNAVAPGPIWTPLIAATFKAEDVATFGADTPMKRPGQPYEVAAAVIFLASDDASYISGQTVHVNGGTVVNG